MLNHPTVDKLHQLRLSGMARALASQAQTPDIGQLSFDERLGLLVDSEAADRAPLAGQIPPPLVTSKSPT